MDNEQSALDRRHEFEKELCALINKYSQESPSDTPDYILAEYLVRCLANYEMTVRPRDKWFGFEPWGRIRRLALGKQGEQ